MRSGPPPDLALETLRGHCRRAGLALTPQRLAIYRALVASLDHPGPEALYDRVKPSMPSLSLATIYKTLETLVRLGVAAELPAAGDTKRYDGQMGPHHHQVCDRCHTIEDLYDAALDVPLPRASRGFRPRTVSVSVHGLCRRCQSVAGEPTTHPRHKEREPWPRT
jgi:Fur family transcriptional regulator, peroxide stress response regulator